MRSRHDLSRHSDAELRGFIDGQDTVLRDAALEEKKRRDREHAEERERERETAQTEMEKNRQGSEASQAFVNRASAQVAADKQADAMKEAAVITATATREVAERQIRIAEAAARAAKMAAWAAVAAALGAIGQVIVAIAK